MHSSRAGLRTVAAVLLIAGPVIAGLAACSDPAPRTPPVAATPSSEVSDSASTNVPTVDIDSIGLEAQSVGIEVAQWSVDHGSRVPANQAEFTSKVKYADSLTAGSQAGYKKSGAKAFQICVTKFADRKALGWSIYDSASGAYQGGTGKPTASFCP